MYSLQPAIGPMLRESSLGMPYALVTFFRNGASQWNRVEILISDNMHHYVFPTNLTALDFWLTRYTWTCFIPDFDLTWCGITHCWLFPVFFSHTEEYIAKTAWNAAIFWRRNLVKMKLPKLYENCAFQQISRTKN